MTVQALLKPRRRMQPQVSAHHSDLLDSFREYAQQQGFTMRRKSEFQSETEFNTYLVRLQGCYNRFVHERNRHPIAFEQPPLPNIPDTVQSRNAFSIKQVLQKIREGAQVVWEEIRLPDEPPRQWSWSGIPEPSRIKERIIDIVPGLALLRFYWKNRNLEARDDQQ